MEILINVYRAAGEWYGARWVGSEYDGCDALGIDGSASDTEAIEHARAMPLTVTGERLVRRVDDV